MLYPLAITLSIALFSHAQQTTNNTQLVIEAIEAHFNNSGIVGSGSDNLLKQFSPSALLTLNYNVVGQVQPGQNLSVDQVKQAPSFSITPANSSTSLSGNFTLTMVDADVVGTDETQNQTRHWLANGVTVSNGALSFDRAVNITDYAGPLPPSNSGPHRYVVILYDQPVSFAPTGNLAQPNQPVSKFDLNQYVSSSGLGPIVAATYYQVEQGTATASISPTSAVVTSTLPAASATSPGSSSGSSAQPTSSGKNSASIAYNINAGMSGLLVVSGFILAQVSTIL